VSAGGGEPRGDRQHASAAGRPGGVLRSHHGVETPGLAVCAGARILEKHLTLDRTLAGPDHAASLEPDAFARCVAFVEQAWTLWGSAEKAPTVSEEENRIHSRKSIHTRRPIAAGEVIGKGDVEILRPATGIPPGRLQEVIGAVATCDLPASTAVHRSHIDGDLE
jgi:Sialic acid synthase